jgi:hypothetical protein
MSNEASPGITDDADRQTVLLIKGTIAEMPVSDQEFITAEARYLQARVQADPRYAMVIALVGASLAAES